MAIDKQISKDFERVDHFISTVIHPVLPNAKLKESFINGAPTTYFEGKLSSGELFKKTDYEYKGDGKFIHYTSLLGLKTILDSGFLRMSEFGNLIDKNELHYAASVFSENPIFSFDKTKTEQLKDSILCLSICESNERTKKNDLMWEVYGDKGKGAIIEFELTKKDPYFFILGKMQYGIEGLKPLSELKKLAENYINNKDNVMFPNNFPELLLELQSFHKSKRYEGENEIRLLLKRNKEFPEDTIYEDINSNQEVKYFNKLFLKGRYPYAEDEIKPNEYGISIFDEFPQIEIKNIILGFNISVENKIAITDLLNEIKAKHNYEFEIFQINDEKEIIKMC